VKHSGNAGLSRAPIRWSGIIATCCAAVSIRHRVTVSCLPPAARHWS